MINRTRFACIASLFALVACGSSSSSEGTLTVRGTLGSSATVDNARAVAIGSDGKRHWAYLDRDGDFTLELPVGTSYRLLIANQLESGYQKTIGHLMIKTSDGRSEWIGANETGTINLGKLRTASSVATTGDTSTHTQCSACSGGGSEDEADEDDDDDDKEHSDDPKCSHESDDDDDDDKNGSSKGSGSEADDDDDDKGGATGTGGEKCKVCGSAESDDEELEPTKNPGDKCKDNEHNAKKPKAPKPDKTPCPYKDKGGSGGSGGTSADAGTGGGCTGSGCGGDAGGSSSGAKKPEGSGCSTTSSCTSTCSCVAATCTNKY